MSKTSLITGATAGIGYELSKIFAKNGYNLVIVSRDKQRLEAIAEDLKNENDIQVKVISKDLCESSAPGELYDKVKADGIDINVLVNNAGFGTNGKFTDFSAEKHMDLIQLNIASLTMLCKLFGTDMIKKRSGSILNVASTAAFQAGPYMSTYYASKAYVLMFSEALNNELAQDGVIVTVLCPGPTQTEFFERNDMVNTNIAKSPHIMKAAVVAQAGFDGLMKGKRIVIPGLVNKTLAFTVRFTPRFIINRITSYLNQKTAVS